MKDTKDVAIQGCSTVIASLLVAAIVSFLYAFAASWVYGEINTAFELNLPQFSYWFWWVASWLIRSVFSK